MHSDSIVEHHCVQDEVIQGIPICLTNYVQFSDYENESECRILAV